jgi:hypothetical protein
MCHHSLINPCRKYIEATAIIEGMVFNIEEVFHLLNIN